jgi:hypothetical protein
MATWHRISGAADDIYQDATPKIASGSRVPPATGNDDGRCCDEQDISVSGSKPG